MPIWLQVLGALVLFVSFVGSAVVFLRGSADKGTIDTLERNNQALSERVGILESNEARLSARVALLERENTALLSQRPSAEVLAVIEHALLEFIPKAQENDAKVVTLLMAIATTLGERDDPHH